MAWKTKKKKLLGKYHIDHLRYISFQEWDAQRENKTKQNPEEKQMVP